MAETDIFQIEEKYKDMTDENLINEATTNQNNMALECLMERYKDIVNMKASKFFMVGSEKDDIVQEGYIGLYKAVKSFDKEKQNSFKTFATICIERQLITAVKNSNRQKHMPLNSSVSLNAAAFDEDENGETSVIEVLDTKRGDVFIFANRNISKVTKVSEELYIDVPLSYEDQIIKQEKILNEACKQIQKLDNVAEAKYIGLNEFASSALVSSPAVKSGTAPAAASCFSKDSTVMGSAFSI